MIKQGENWLAHHIVWAVAAVAIALIIGFFFGGRASAPSSAAPTRQEQELQALINAIRAVPLAHAPVSPLDKPAVTVIRNLIPTGGFTDAEIVAFLRALGTQRTVPVISAKIQGPPPASIPLDKEGKLIYDAAYAADTHALAESRIAVSVTQQPVAPSRFSVAYFSNGAAGVGYAFKRKGQFDLNGNVFVDAGKLAPGASVVYRIKGTEAGIGLGALLSGGKVVPGATLSISF